MFDQTSTTELSVFSRRILTTVAVGALTSVAAMPVSAQNDTAEDVAEAPAVEQIFVTARQRAETIQDVPATITAITSETIQRAGVERAEDFIALTPGVTIVDAAEAGDTQVNIRGINGARDAENSFAFILDGVLQTNPAAFNREFTDLQQIEILKGPQGAIYGRNASAGAIIVTTTTPGDEVEVTAKASIAEYDSYFASASLSGPIVPGVLAGRVSGDFRTTVGFYENTFQDRDDIVDNFESFNVNGRLVWTPTTNTEADFKIRYGEVDAGSISYNAVFAAEFLAGLFGVPELFEDVNDHEFVFQSNVTSDNNQESLELSGKVEHEFGFGTLTGWALYSDVEQDLLADGTSASFGFFFQEPTCRASADTLFNAGVTLPAPQFLAPTPEDSIFGPYTPTTCDGYQYQVRNQSDLSVELRLASPDDQALRWLVGGYFLDLEREVGVATGLDTGGAIIPALFNGPDTSSPTEQLVSDEFNSQVMAVFGQLAYDLSDTVEAAVALRYDREEREVANLVPTDARTQFIDFTNDGVFSGGAPLNPALDPTINPEGVPDLEETFEKLQPKVTLSWDASDAVTVFGSWGVGFKSGGFNNRGSAATIDLFINEPLGANVLIEDVFADETSSAFELGAKGTFLDGRVRADAAVFHTTVDDMQFFEFFVGPFGLLRVVSNIDEVTIEGIEFGASANVTDVLSVFGGAAFIDSQIEANSSRPETVGNKSPYTAEYTLNLGAQVDVPVTSALSLVGRVDWRRTGETFFHTVQEQTNPSLFGPANYSRSTRDAFDVVDLRVGVESGAWGVTAFANNLFDEDILEEVIPAPEFGGSFVQPGARQQIGLEIAYRR